MRPRDQESYNLVGESPSASVTTLLSFLVSPEEADVPELLSSDMWPRDEFVIWLES